LWSRRWVAGIGLLVLTLAACDSNPAAPTATPVAATATVATLPPTVAATPSPAPAATATALPPTIAPTIAPTEPPTVAPTAPPTVAPTEPPTVAPTEPATATSAPPTEAPTVAPTRAATKPPAPAATVPPPAGADPHRVAGDLSAVSRGLRGKHQVALTFDAGAGRGQPEEILRVLKAHNVHITFFLTGKWVEENPDAARAIAADGHEIANHSYSHPSFFKLTQAERWAEIDKAEALIRDTTGQTAQPYFRAPYGDTDDTVDASIRAHGYRDFLWTLDSLDSVGQPKTANFIYNRICNTTWLDMDGAIFLQHIAAPASVEALPRILDTLQERGWHVVTLTELLTP
jgi:peptidoglycan/xylan/chitin deacetylase (PgdA/CDA1 family)